MNKVFKLKYKTHFDAAHYLPKHKGKCKNLHGHRWEVEIRIKSFDSLNKDGMIIDFSELKNLVDKLDHTSLNKYMKNPTAENVAFIIYGWVSNLFIDCPVFVSISVWESPGAEIVYEDTLMKAVKK